MARTLTAAMLAAIAAETIRPVLIVKIGTSGSDINLWTGIGDLTHLGETYNGVGNLGGVSQVQETQNLEANGMSFTLTGIDSAMVSAILGSMRYGRPAKMWLGLIDTTTNLLVDAAMQMFVGLTDVPSMEEGPESATISITAENRLADLERPRARRYTTEDQKLTDPTDLGFDYVPTLQDAVFPWGLGR
jgi:hypothetical protein